MNKKVLLPLMACACTMIFSSCGKNSDWDVTMNGKNFELPCDVDDLGDDFKLSTDLVYEKEDNGLSSVLLFNGDDMCATVKVEADSKEDVDEKSDIHGITFSSLTGKTDLEIDGIGNGATKDEVIKKLGEPEKETSIGLKYVSGDYTAVFAFDESEKVKGMGIYDKEAIEAIDD